MQWKTNRIGVILFLTCLCAQADDASPNDEKKTDDEENNATEATTNGTTADEPAADAAAAAKPAETNGAGETNGSPAAVAESEKGES